MRTHAPRPTSRASWLGALVLLVPAVLLLAQAPAADGPVTVEDARRFIAQAEETLNTLGVRASRADWVQSTYITSDTQAIAAETREAQIRAATRVRQGGRPVSGRCSCRRISRGS